MKTKEELLQWYRLESECDMHNYNEFLRMDKKHLSKSKIKDFGSSISKSKTNNAKKIKECLSNVN